MSELDGAFIFAYIVVGFVIGVLLVSIIYNFSILGTIYLNQETADDICINLTGNQSSIASSESGKLICETPSYDSTTNIIVREVGHE